MVSLLYIRIQGEPYWRTQAVVWQFYLNTEVPFKEAFCKLPGTINRYIDANSVDYILHGFRITEV